MMWRGMRGALAALSLGACLAQEEDKKLWEIPASDMEEGKPGMQPFVNEFTEPSGATAMAFVKKGSKNHKLMKELASATSDSDPALYELNLPMGAVTDYEENEMVMIVKRQYAQDVWEALNDTALDTEPLIFPGSMPGKVWKKKQLREWLIENAYPTFNFRLMRGDRPHIPKFPWYKYFGEPNKQGVGLVVCNFSALDTQLLQVRMVSALRPYIQSLKGKFRFTVMERSEFTLPAREASKLAMDDTTQAELILIEDPHTIVPRTKVDNYFHGSPKKYRLTNFSELAVMDFFAAYAAKKLPTYWTSTEVGARAPKQVGDAVHLNAQMFEERILKADKAVGAFVAFFNLDPEESCGPCIPKLEIWKKVATKLKKLKFFQDIVIAHIDQSSNEHAESKVAQRLGEPIIMWYPPGTPKRRWKNRIFLHDMATDFTEEALPGALQDYLADALEENAEL